ncbi:EAL domain-containing protein [Arcobacteraceae bacterium]|nr:EAL domain-containing protein [Arcobacteraceae bacterium]
MLEISRFFDKILKNPLKLKFFFAFSFIFFAIVIVTISFIVNYTYESKYMSEDMHNKASSTIQNKVKEFKHYINMHRFSMEAISNNGIFKNYLKTPTTKNNVIDLFETIIGSDQNVMQIRYIDENGAENIRIDRSQKEYLYKVIHDKDLQNKKDRYYFKEISKLKENSPMWISDIDLNIENGKIQQPHVPTVRFGKPVYSGNEFKGIIILNIFMKDILNSLTKSDMFLISLMDKDGEFLIGKDEIDNSIVDYSWSKFLLKKVNIENYAPEYINQILNTYEFRSELFHSRKISSEVGLSQELILVLKIKKAKIDEIKENTLHKILDTLGIVLLISGPIGLLLAYIPSVLATKVYRSSQKLDEKTMVFDEYLDAMNVNNIISKSNLKGKITYVNNNFCEVSGYTREEVLGKPHSILRDPTQSKETFKILWLTIQSGKTWKGILRNKKKDGSLYDVDIAIMPIKNTNNEIIEYLAIRHDITELAKQRKNLLAVATKDPLTDVGNRYKLNLDLEDHLINNVAVIDIDNFAQINDFFGHKIGDEVIIKFSKLLLENLTDEFQLYRLHSDKFAILNYTLDSTRFVNFISNLNTNMIESIIKTDLESFDIVTTSGISSCNKEIIISTAEIANKHAKKINKKILTYSTELNIEKEFEKNITWTQKVKKALTEDRIIMHYQPLYNNHTNKIEKYEALVRLEDEDGTIISPFYFLDIAKSSAQYIDITKVVIEKSFEKFKNVDIEFSINLTIEDILDSELCEYLEEMIYKYDIADKLVLELVESEGIEQFDIIQKFIKRVKNLGCKIAIDDFGTGYSNFEYLVKLEADYIKIDGSMIKNINTDPNMREIVETIIDFAKKMNYKTIGEFVATKELLDTVQELEINYAQGYYIGAPDENLQEENNIIR